MDPFWLHCSTWVDEDCGPSPDPVPAELERSGAGGQTWSRRRMLLGTLGGASLLLGCERKRNKQTAAPLPAGGPASGPAGTHSTKEQAPPRGPAATVAALLDLLLPDGEFPGHRATAVLERLQPQMPEGGKWAPWLARAVDLVDARARQRGAEDFLSLPAAERESLWAELAGRSPPYRFFYVLREKVMRLHYTHPAAWQALGFPHAPQPIGFLDYEHAPRKRT